MVALAILLLSGGPFSYSTKGGATITLASVSDDYAMRSWSPDGTPQAKWLSNATVMEDRNSSMNPDHLMGKLSLLFLVEHPSDEHFSYDFDGSPLAIGQWRAIPADFSTIVDGVHNPPEIAPTLDGPFGTAPVDVQLNFSDQPWRIEGYYVKANKKLSGNLSMPVVSVTASKWVVVQARAKEVEPNRRYSLLLVDAAGKAFDSTMVTRNPKDPGRLEFGYRVCGRALGRVELRSRPMETFVFRGVRLHPLSSG